MSPTPPASEVVRLAEADLKNAVSLRTEAARLLAAAAAEEAAALSRAVEVLGPVYGRTAYDLAALTVGQAPAYEASRRPPEKRQEDVPHADQPALTAIPDPVPETIPDPETVPETE